MNYRIVELPTWKVSNKLFTLSEAKKEIAHVHCFGIMNDTTGKMVIFHTWNGWIFPLRIINQFTERCNRIVSKRSNFNYHPQQ